MTISVGNVHCLVIHQKRTISKQLDVGLDLTKHCQKKLKFCFFVRIVFYVLNLLLKYVAFYWRLQFIDSIANSMKIDSAFYLYNNNSIKDLHI